MTDEEAKATAKALNNPVVRRAFDKFRRSMAKLRDEGTTVELIGKSADGTEMKWSSASLPANKRRRRK